MGKKWGGSSAADLRLKESVRDHLSTLFMNIFSACSNEWNVILPLVLRTDLNMKLLLSRPSFLRGSDAKDTADAADDVCCL